MVTWWVFLRVGWWGVSPHPKKHPTRHEEFRQVPPCGGVNSNHPAPRVEAAETLVGWWGGCSPPTGAE